MHAIFFKPWVCGAYSQHKDLQTTVWGGSLVGVKNKTVIPKSGHSLVTISNISFSFKRGSNYKALIGKILVHWKSRCLWEVVAYERCLFIRGGHIWRFDWSLRGMTLGLYRSLVLTLQTPLPNFSVLPKQVSLLLKQFKVLDNSCLFLHHCIMLAAQGFRWQILINNFRTIRCNYVLWRFQH